MSHAADGLSDYDLHLLGEGRHDRTWQKLGAHLGELDGISEERRVGKEC